MPPVTEFWEMPLYDSEGYFYDNPINRYSLNSYMPKRGKLHTENGSLAARTEGGFRIAAQGPCGCAWNETHGLINPVGYTYSLRM